MSWLHKGFGAAITFFYQGIPSLGVAIILLTIAVNMVMFPLTLKQTRSMRKMQELQPDIKQLQRDLKHDKQALQQATMELYRERGVNPLAGCLPLVLQLPVWWAVFQVLRSFAGANPTAYVIKGWRLFTHITDWKVAVDQGLAAVGAWKDFLWMDLGVTPSAAFRESFVTAIPYLVTILVVMGTAYYQQAQTQAKQKNQMAEGEKTPGQALMKVMPFFFGFISFTLPAGLVVYFAASQIFRIGQQGLIIWLDGRHEAQVETETASEKKVRRQRGVPERPGRAAEPERPPRPASPERRPRLAEGDRGPGAEARFEGGQKARGKKRKRR